MLNIFNLFLFLFALWIIFMFSAAHVSWFYVFCGVALSALISLASFHFKLIEKKSELLYLSLGFYRNFAKIYFSNFFRGIFLIINLAVGRKSMRPMLFRLKFDEKNKFNPALLMASFSMSVGLFALGMNEDEILIHAIDEDLFDKFDLQKVCQDLNEVNDDNLV